MLQASIQLYRNAFGGIPRPVWWLSLVMLVNRSGTMVIPFLTVYLTSRGFTLAQAGSVMAAFGVGAFLGGYLGGRLTDMFGFFRVQVASLVLNGILFVVLGYMESLAQIMICVFVLSTCGEAFRPANAAAIGAYSNEDNRTRSYSLNRLAINLGWAIGPAAGGILASINYKLLFWVDGATCTVAGLLLYLFLAKGSRRDGHNNPQARTSGAASAYKDKVYLAGMFFILLVALCFFQLFSIIPVYYKEHVGLSEVVIGAVLASNGILIVLVEMVLVYRLEQHKRPLLYIFYGAVVIGVSFLLLAVAPVLTFVALSMVVITFGEMLLFPFTNDFWVSRTDARNRGQYAAIYTMTFAVAHVLSPLLSSRIAAVLGFPALFVIDFILCCLGGAGFIWLQRKMHAHGHIQPYGTTQVVGS
jgi:predicted MFS family arabinose efflux permease